MVYFAHDAHLCFNLLVVRTILHEALLFQFLSSIRNTGILVCKLVDYGKSTSANHVNLIVFSSAFPFSSSSANNWSRRESQRGNWRLCKEVRLDTVSKQV